MVDIWYRRIPSANKTLSIKDGVCQLHFTPSDIYTTKVFIRDNDIGFETNVDSCDYVDNLLIQIENMKLCPSFILNSSQQWSPRCLLRIKGKESRCKYCSYQNNFSKLKEEKVNCLIKDLPEKQQEVIKMCFKVCSTQSGHGIKYTTNWMYREKILLLPSTVPSQWYIKKLKPAYGFQTSTFQMLEEKSKNIKSAECHGYLFLDEMSLSPSVTFNKSTLNVDRLVDLGKYTPERKENEFGNHALLIVKAVILLEKSGFKVHNIVTDGGPWNRGMWNSFGITNTNVSGQHPMDSERRLWFIFDFPHLIKTMWTRILKNKILKYWKYLVQHDELKHIKLCYKLIKDYLFPQHFQKMNVKMAMVMIADCMEELLNRGENNFIGCEPTVKFIKKINDLVDVLNSNTEKHSQQADPNSNSNKILSDFKNYIETWMLEIQDKNLRFTSQTERGLIVSIKETLDLIQFLSQNVGYRYLMTKQINQDALEHFFGIIRQACGSNQHPDPRQFVQIY
ncbi:hypothetical protein QTP88_011344 [Uroleucon formosanum]